jgi:molybdopterin/thiamine biosynthesis adenylyltransferase
MENSYYYERYSRQILFSQIGEKGQKKLFKSRVLIIGCGGLGTNIVNNLVRSGIGFIRIIDKDKIELSNLQRQQLFDEEDVKKGLPKAIVAKNKLNLINSDVKIEAIVDEVNEKNIEEYIQEVDLVFDGTDNFNTRFLIDKYCVKNHTPWIFGAVAANYGMVFNIIPSSGFNFKSIFGKLPPDFEGLSSNNVGILNSAVNIVSSIQTTEGIKILTGDLDSLIKGLIFVDVWDLSIDIIKIY